MAIGLGDKNPNLAHSVWGRLCRFHPYSDAIRHVIALGCARPWSAQPGARFFLSHRLRRGDHQFVLGRRAGLPGVLLAGLAQVGVAERDRRA
jgi:hypothetical protein